MRKLGLWEAEKEVGRLPESRGWSQGTETRLPHMQQVSCLNQEPSGETSEPTAARPDPSRGSLEKDALALLGKCSDLGSRKSASLPWFCLYFPR